MDERKKETVMRQRKRRRISSGVTMLLLVSGASDAIPLSSCSSKNNIAFLVPD